ncbi:glycosyl hydrolase family 8 [Sodalis endosymbiont of Spalangia cameroni]|uniref:glycosyl hydrolase family 8 n=1 Tax=Sodalis praecaptivus TaxID=1239307 RepID=UPI0031F7490B
MKRFGQLTCLLGLTLTLLAGGARAESAGWAQYKHRFLLPEGRIIDTGNHNVSHSEGQGFGMLLAVYNNDRPTFDLLYQWTRAHLYQQDSGLNAWRFDPASTPPVADRNNATDGDTLIAWALLQAGQKWRQPDYLQASKALQQAIVQRTVVEFAGLKVLLPGMEGFKQADALTLNPSYFIFPAWQAFYQQSHLPIWNELSSDARQLLSKMRFGAPRLPTDWVRLDANGGVAPGDRWPARFSFDAVRIPLYLHWAQPDSQALGPYIAYWRQYDRLSTPAWVDVQSGEKADYMLPPGMLAIRDAILANGAQVTDRLQNSEDYYSASLHLLTYWSLQRQ